MRRSQGEGSFALVSTLLIVAVMALGGLAFFQAARMDRLVTRNTADRVRAELAAESGLAAAQSLLRAMTANDHFLIVLNATNRQLFAGNGTNITAPATFAYQPLFSHATNLTNYTTNTNNLVTTSSNPVTNVSGGILFTNSLPGGLTVTSPAVAWVYLTNSAGRTNARFAFWVEDLSGRLDLSVAGGTGTNAQRPTGTNPAELALWSLFNPSAANDSNNAVVTDLTNARSAVLTPASARLVNSAVTTNLLADLAAGLIHDTNEPEIIPFGFGYADRGRPKYNLQLYGTNLTNGSTNLLSILTNNLNNNGGFDSRAGGMNGTRYLHALAVNIQDYIDPDINPTFITNIGGGPVRGIEPLPFVTETATSVWWYDHGTNIPGFVGNIADEIHLANYVELWNPSDRSFSGNLTIGFSNNYACGSVNGVAIDLTITNTTGSRVWTNTLGSTHPHTNVINVNPPLEPNEYRVFFLGTNIYRFRVLAAAAPEGSWYNGRQANANGFLRLGQPAAGTSDSFTSTLSIEYGGVVYDRVANIHRVGNRTIYCRRFASGNNANPDWAGNVPALRMTPTESPALPGDPRIGFYLTSTNNAQGYATTPANPGSSMGFRNRGISSGGTLYETAPNRWLDSGHANSPLQTGTVTDANFPSTGRQTTAFTNDNVQKFNNSGTWSNVLELGNVFDPVAWNVPTNSLHISTSNTAAGNGSTTLTSGGGTTLRIGRAEHGRFTNSGLRASQLLDLFALGTNPAVTVIPTRVAGRINLNTATPNVLRALAAGVVHARDPALNPGGTNFTVPVAAVTNFVAGVTNWRATRPFFSPAELTLITNGTGGYPTNAVFGNRTLAGVTAWNDLAAEEWFSKIYPLATVRSRNFLVHVIGQTMTTNTNFPTRPTASSRQVFQLYAEPVRDASGLTTNVVVRKLASWSL